jgi:serine/threonine-protein kinase
VVRRGRHTHLKRDVAIKILNAADWTAETAALFERECRALASIDHPHVVRVHDAGVDTQTSSAFIVMELMAGGTLADHVPTSPVAAVAAIRDAAKGLAAVHARGIVHRDIKPQNLLVANDGTVKVADLGIAHLDPYYHSNVPTAGQGPLGTLAYAAPELLHGAPASRASDVYALGATLYTLLTGHPPYQQTPESATPARLVHAILHEPVPVLELDGAPGVSEIVSACLDKDPTRRPSVRSVGEHLDLLIPNGPPPFHGPPRVAATVARSESIDPDPLHASTLVSPRLLDHPTHLIGEPPTNQLRYDPSTRSDHGSAGPIDVPKTKVPPTWDAKTRSSQVRIALVIEVLVLLGLIGAFVALRVTRGGGGELAETVPSSAVTVPASTTTTAPTTETTTTTTVPPSDAMSLRDAAGAYGTVVEVAEISQPWGKGNVGFAGYGANALEADGVNVRMFEFDGSSWTPVDQFFLSNGPVQDLEVVDVTGEGNDDLHVTMSRDGNEEHGFLTTAQTGAWDWATYSYAAEGAEGTADAKFFGRVEIFPGSGEITVYEYDCSTTCGDSFHDPSYLRWYGESGFGYFGD